jgi:hypothetical protein
MDAEIALENEALLAIYSEEIQFRSERDCLYNYNVPQNQLLNGELLRFIRIFLFLLFHF